MLFSHPFLSSFLNQANKKKSKGGYSVFVVPLLKIQRLHESVDRKASISAGEDRKTKAKGVKRSNIKNKTI